MIIITLLHNICYGMSLVKYPEKFHVCPTLYHIILNHILIIILIHLFLNPRDETTQGAVRKQVEQTNPLTTMIN